MTPGQVLTNQIREAASKVGARLFVMVTGKFWAGVPVGRTEQGHMILKNARLVNVGFSGLSDTLGFTPVVITAEMVGQTVAVVTAIEVKAGKDRPRPGQPEFIQAVQKAGGRAGFARSVEDALRIARGQNGESSIRE
jgi:hypothetical protein